MQKKKFDKVWLENHFRYAGWKYVLLIVSAVLGWSLLFTVTAYRTPPERKVDIYVTGPYSDSQQLDLLSAQAQEELSPLYENLEEISAFSVVLEGGDSETAMYGQQIMMVRIGAAEGDIFLVTRGWLMSFAEEGLALPLDDAIASGALSAPFDLSDGRFAVEIGEYAGIQKQYAIPMSEMYGFIENERYDNRYAYMVIPAYTKNPDGAVRVMQWLIDNRTQPKPDWME